MTVFDRRNEAMRPEMLQQVQLERLQALLARLKRKVRRYNELIGDVRIEALAQLDRLPFTTPGDLHQAFPYGMFALPLREVIQLHSTVGPSGQQLVVGHTSNDLNNWARLAARQLVAAGVTSNDVIQICLHGSSLGSFLGYLLGAELVEASVIPEDAVHIDYQVEVIRNYRTTVLVTTPTNAHDLIALLREQRIDPQSLHLRTILLTRPVGAEEREELENGLLAPVRCNFGVSEVADPGLCVQCERGDLHVNEDFFLCEAVDGELVVTTLCWEAMPLLRYRTGWSCSLDRRKCDCGRTGTILTPGKRLDGRMRVNETPLYREQITEVLGKTKAAGQTFHLDISEHSVALDIEMSEQFFADQMRVLAELRKEIELEFLTRLGIRAEIRYVAPASCAAGPV